jgi:hypothetical protein
MSAFEEIRGKAESERMGDGGWGMGDEKRQKAKGKRQKDGGWEGGSPFAALVFPLF